MFQKICIAVLLIFSSFSSLTAENYQVSSKTEWTKALWVLSITYPLKNSEKVLPALKSQAEDIISDNLKDIIFDQLQSVVLDSRTTVKDYVKKHPEVIQSIYNLSGNAHRTFSLLSDDMKNVEIQYTIKLYPDIASIFMQHQILTPIEPLLSFYPSTDFSGIVIYVKKALPLFGKNKKGKFVPSLFPRIYTENMRLLMNKYNVSPASIKKWGVAGFRTDLNIRDIEKRAGFTPLRIVARGLFGINNTDIIIPASAAARILSRKSNINLIYSGRIIIVYVR